MEYFEAEGRSVEEALQKICEERNLRVEDLDYTVVEQKRRLLGILGKESVTIRAWKKLDEPRDPLHVFQEICDRAGLKCKGAYVRGSEDPLTIDITGEDLGIAIGKNGEVLDALQYLVNKISNRGSPNPRKIVLDADGYRERKLANLRRLALRTAEQVKETGRSVVLNPMSAHDRRIIHLQLKEDPEVFTRSMGDGPFKKIMIGLKRGNREPRRTKRRT
jgi:spoIIIJ-associated protein